MMNKELSPSSLFYNAVNSNLLQRCLKADLWNRGLTISTPSNFHAIFHHQYSVYYHSFNKFTNMVKMSDQSAPEGAYWLDSTVCAYIFVYRVEMANLALKYVNRFLRKYEKYVPFISELIFLQRNFLTQSILHTCFSQLYPLLCMLFFNSLSPRDALLPIYCGLCLKGSIFYRTNITIMSLKPFI